MSERADLDGSEPVAPRTVEAEDPVISRFDPMLRSLLAFGLVEADGDDGTAQWRLVPAVQRRLQSLVSPAPPADKLIYFGHRCGSCGEHAPTRISSGTFLCDACRTTPVEELIARRQPRPA